MILVLLFLTIFKLLAGTSKVNYGKGPGREQHHWDQREGVISEKREALTKSIDPIYDISIID